MMKLPEIFQDRMSLLLGNEFDSFMAALNGESPTSIRLNTAKTDHITTLFPDGKKIPWTSDGYYLPSRPSFTFDPLFHAGCYYVQEASSMFLEQVIKEHVSQPVKCLDLCAAPGGKSTLLSSTLPQESLLVCNELIRSRANILAENVIKWGNSHTIVTNNDPAVIGQLTHFFDVIVADLPCSGEGMFRKDPNSIEEWSPANVNLCADRQKRIVADCWNSLKPGGLFVYSTCTYNTEENETNINWIVENLDAEVLSVPVNPDWKIEGAKRFQYPVYRFFPHRTNGEGFFIAVLRKKGSGEEAYINDHDRKRRKENKPRKNIPAFPSEVFSWINSKDVFDFEMENDSLFAIPTKYKSEYLKLKQILKVMHAGIKLATVKGKDIIPDHNLAMSVHLNKDIFPSLELERESAISFLRKEALMDLSVDIPKGFNIVRYQGYPLGFIKNIGNRANNLYPQEWRIRKSI